MNEVIKEIYKMESIKTIGQGLKKLEPKGKFYLLINELRMCQNLRNFEQFIADLSVSYSLLCDKEGLLSIEEIIELLKLAEDKDNLRTIVTAIMIFSVCD